MDLCRRRKILKFVARSFLEDPGLLTAWSERHFSHWVCYLWLMMIFHQIFPIFCCKFLKAYTKTLVCLRQELLNLSISNQKSQLRHMWYKYFMQVELCIFSGTCWYLIILHMVLCNLSTDVFQIMYCQYSLFSPTIFYCQNGFKSFMFWHIGQYPVNK